jgi:hypothetical protein
LWGEEPRRTVAVVGVSRSSLLVGLLEFTVAAMVPLAVIWLVLHFEELGERLMSFGRRCGMLRRPPVCAAVPPVERLAADLRRLAAAVEHLPRGASHARHRGLLMAYDDALVTACRSLEVPQSLGTLPYGLDRDLERLRVEASLESAGLRFRPAAR